MIRKFEKRKRSPGLTMQAIRDMDIKIQAMSIIQSKVEVKTVPIV